MNNLVEKSLQRLSVQCNKSALHPMDEDKIKVTLKTLYKHNVEINVNEIESWLVENNWKNMPVKNFTKWANTITTGGRVQIKHKQMAPSEKKVWQKLNV